MCDVLDRAEEKGKELIITLNNILIDSGRIDDLIKASKDEVYLNKLITELMPNFK